MLLGKKCGKPNCRCADGKTHPTHYLSISEEGKRRMVHVRAADKTKVESAALRYRRFREARAALARLASEVSSLADDLRARLTDNYPPPGPNGEKAPRSEGERGLGAGRVGRAVDGRRGDRARSSARSPKRTGGSNRSVRTQRKGGGSERW